MTSFINTMYGEFLDADKAFRFWVRPFPIDVEENNQTVQKTVYYVKADFLVPVNTNSASEKVFDTLTVDIAEFDSNEQAKSFLERLMKEVLAYKDIKNIAENKE